MGCRTGQIPRLEAVNAFARENLVQWLQEDGLLTHAFRGSREGHLAGPRQRFAGRTTTAAAIMPILRRVQTECVTNQNFVDHDLLAETAFGPKLKSRHGKTVRQ